MTQREGGNRRLKKREKQEGESGGRVSMKINLSDSLSLSFSMLLLSTRVILHTVCLIEVVKRALKRMKRVRIVFQSHCLWQIRLVTLVILSQMLLVLQGREREKQRSHEEQDVNSQVV